MRCFVHFFLFSFLFPVSLIGEECKLNYSNLDFEHITVSDGLPWPTVLDIVQDQDGFLWFATENGLSRYDAYEFQTYQYDPSDSAGLTNNHISCLLEDENGDIWIGTSYGLNRYNKRTGTFSHFFHEQNNHNSLWDNSIKDLYLDSHGNIWIGTSNGVNIYNKNSGVITRFDLCIHSNRKGITTRRNGKGYSVNALVEGEQETLWIGTWGKGLFNVNLHNKACRQYLLGNELEDNIVTTIIKDPRGMLHLGSEKIPHVIFDPGKGRIIDTINKQHGSIRSALVDNKRNIWIGGNKELTIFSGIDNSRMAYYKAVSTIKNGLSEGIIEAIYQDQAGNIWISSSGKGLDIYFPCKNNFNNYFHEIEDENHHDFGKTFYADHQHNLWYATFGDGLLLFDDNAQMVKRVIDKSEGSSLANYIWCIVQDKSGKIWIGSGQGIYKLDSRGRTFVPPVIQGKDINNLLTHHVVYEILFFDEKQEIWIATQEGLDIVNRNTGHFRHITEQDGLSHYKIQKMIKGKKGNIWIGTYDGLSIYDPENEKIKKCYHGPEKSGILSNKSVNTLYQDKQGIIWIGTDNGLNRLNPENEHIKYYFEKHGLINNRVENIFEDNDGNLWIQTSIGLSKMNHDEESFINYDSEDGLKINHTGMYLRDTILYIAGLNKGFYKINLDKIKQNPYIPPVYLTKIKVNGQEIQLPTGEKGQDKLLNLEYNRSSLEFYFTALNYLSPDKNQYKYKLEGFDQEWEYTTASKRYAVYANIPPGTYTFKVKGSNNNEKWNEKITRLTFKILPPWWKTWWAIVIYFIALGALLYLMYLLVQKSTQLKIQQEKAKMQHENDNLKLKFFTNISHEFRTPLTLILGIMEKLTTVPRLNSNIQHQLNIVFNNANRMYRLTNQILELRKLQGKTIHPVYHENDIALFMNELYESFHHYARLKNIRYFIEAEKDTYTCLFDPDKLETIVINLLSNAFKFTPENGTIILHWNVLDEIPDNLPLIKRDLYTSCLNIEVSNTGKQIPEQDIEKIFDRFYQTELSANQYQKGTGIGLSLVKELVSVMSGNISVDSTREGKTIFTVIIPVPAKETVSMKFKEKNDIKKSITSKKREYPILNKINEFKSKKDSGNKNNEETPVILITEDNDDVRAFIASLFHEDFKIIEAKNGKEGFNKALKHLPDIIISDIMMPDEDGFEFCHNVKMNEKTNHIPFVLLTARTADDYKLEGYKTGADDYIIKPFNSNILKARVNNILLNRSMLQDYYRNYYLLDSGTGTMEKTPKKNVNDQFLQKVKKMVYDNMHDENYSVSQLSEGMEISRIHLNRKLHAILGISPSEFIKLCRLKKGMQLLTGDKRMTVSEVAYTIGFKEASYFSKSFKKHYGKSPSDI